MSSAPHMLHSPTHPTEGKHLAGAFLHVTGTHLSRKVIWQVRQGSNTGVEGRNRDRECAGGGGFSGDGLHGSFSLGSNLPAPYLS